MKITTTMPLQQKFASKQEAQEAGLRDAAKMYEQHFLGEMVKSMRSTVHREDGFIAPNMAENIFSEQLDQQYVENWSNKGGIGLGDMIYNQLHERLFPARKDFSKPAGPIPFEKAGSPFEIKVEKKGNAEAPAGQVTFKGGATSPLVQATPVSSPWGGQIESAAVKEDWSFVSILHDNKLRSELAFQGPLKGIESGKRVAAGDVIGQLASNGPTLRWKVSDRSEDVA